MVASTGTVYQHGLINDGIICKKLESSFLTTETVLVVEINKIKEHRVITYMNQLHEI